MDEYIVEKSSLQMRIYNVNKRANIFSNKCICVTVFHPFGEKFKNTNKIGTRIYLSSRALA
jgi:hypothetical protein